MSHKQLVEICNPQLEIDLQKTNWLPICISGVQWYVAENSTIDNATGSETSIVKIYKQTTAIANNTDIVNAFAALSLTVSVSGCDLIIDNWNIRLL